jgi:Aldehyde ferredoxin oxidoreductase, N-terminal domain.
VGESLPGGYVGKVAFIDLTKKKVSVQPLNMEWARLYMAVRV